MENSQNSLSHQFSKAILTSHKSRKLLKAIKESESNFKFYSWDLLENYAYICYLSNFRAIFESKEERKRLRVFTHMGRLIKTRTAHQTKSHHQKMMLKHGTVEDIISSVTNRITNELRQKPHLVPEIERINREAEDFFQIEVEKYAMERTKTEQSKKGHNSKQMAARTKMQGEEVKIQQDLQSYFLQQVKLEQNSVMAEFACLKEEESSDMILRVSP